MADTTQLNSIVHMEFCCPPGAESSLRELQRVVHANARHKGFWPDGRNAGEAVALIHSEASELLEALRSGNPPSVKSSGFTAAEEELADLVIRVLDFAGGFGFDVAGALAAKMTYNANRPHKHGREF